MTGRQYIYRERASEREKQTRHKYLIGEKTVYDLERDGQHAARSKCGRQPVYRLLANVRVTNLIPVAINAAVAVAAAVRAPGAAILQLIGP
jgi:hypothetical protein